MSNAVKKIIVVGGGTAGWLTAALVAANHKDGVKVTLVESSDIPTIGVGEGTWPTMKNTIKQIGLKESDVFRRCHAAFKQGGKFVNWVHSEDDFYYHPFTVPLGYGRLDLAPYVAYIEQYAVESNFQHHVCEAGLAPRGLSDAEFQGPCNYAYHLDAGAFAELLKEHSINTLGVEHVVDTVKGAKQDDIGNITNIELEKYGAMDGDLFVDCTGFASALLGKTLNVPFVSTDRVLFNDTALAVQVPYKSNTSPVASHTIATGQKTGWVWDIGLTNRRGVGYVYSSDFIDHEDAERILNDYIGDEFEQLNTRKISFNSGHRELFWKNNCVAVGLSAGFVEPLEATALMLIEISARYISDNLPADKSLMKVTAKRFNEQMLYRWRRIIDFLKLHYMLTKRPEPYWQANTEKSSIPESLLEDLEMWQFRGPTSSDFDSAIELFPAASYQYVIYGMGFKPDFNRQAYLYNQQEKADQIMRNNQKLTQQMLQTLPPHRDYIEQWLAKTGAKKTL